MPVLLLVLLLQELVLLLVAQPVGSCLFSAVPWGSAPRFAAGTRQCPPSAAWHQCPGRGEAVQCPFLQGHEEALALSAKHKGLAVAPVLQEQKLL